MKNPSVLCTLYKISHKTEFAIDEKYQTLLFYGIKLAGVYDIDPARNELARSRGIRAYASREELLADPSIDLVTIATPNDVHKEIAIAALNAGTSRQLAAQAADELLNISGITASFVLYPNDDQVVVSARSIGDANVQVILEPLGGGGNTATAGAQISGSSVKEVLDLLVASIDQYYES